MDGDVIGRPVTGTTTASAAAGVVRRGRTAIIAVAVLVAVTGGIGAANAAGPVQNQVGNLITPCRLIDTRPAPDKVGPRGTPIGAGETFTTPVTGSNGNCVLPPTATGIIANVTAVAPTAESFLTVWPADQTRPTASNLNWVGGQRPVPNQVTTPLSATGSVSIYNNSGTVDVIIDVVGYFTAQDLSNYYTKSQVDAAVASAGIAKNRVVNPSFETDTYQNPPAGWSTTGPSNSGAGVPYSVFPGPLTPPAGGGNNVNTLRSGGTLTQSIPVSAECTGLPLAFSAFALARQGDGTLTVEFVGNGQQNNQALPSTNAPGALPMTQYTYSTNVPAGTTAVKITFAFPTGNYLWVDLVSLKILGC